MADIFISYKREDQKKVKTLAEALKRQGWSVWWDPKLRSGEFFDDVIEQAIEDAKCVIVVWSHRSIRSQNVKDESAYALKQKKLIPVSIEKVEPPFRFQRLHTQQLSDWDGSDNFPPFQKLVDDIAIIIKASVKKSDIHPQQNDISFDRRIADILSDASLTTEQKEHLCTKMYQEKFYIKEKALALQDSQHCNKILADPGLSWQKKSELFSKRYQERADLRRKRAEREYEEFIEVIEGKVDKKARLHLRERLKFEGLLMFSEISKKLTDEFLEEKRYILDEENKMFSKLFGWNRTDDE